MDINEKIIKLLVAAGYVTKEKVEQARHLAETLKWEDENASQQSVQLTGLCVCPEEWSVDIHGNCSNCGLAKTPRN